MHIYRSAELLSTLTNSLLSSFNPREVSSARGVVVCAQALLVIGALSSSGFLAGSTIASKSLADVISEYTVKSTSSSVRRRLAISNTTQYPVNTAVSSLVKGVLLGMAPGQTPVSLASTNIQVYRYYI
jgi:hypothetical protein